MLDWKPYLESICKKYARWWESYTITNVVAKSHDNQMPKSLLLDLQALTVKPETIKPERELLPETREEREILGVLEGLRKYALLHVLLIGRPGSGKSTALVRLLLEEAEGFGDKTDRGDRGDETVIAKDSAMRKPPPSAIATNYSKTRIPVLVELRYYETSILDLITGFLHRHDPSLTIDSENIKTLLRQGQLLLLIDGVNELPSPEARSHLQKFRQDYQQTTPMIFTTRDLGVGGDLGITKKLEMRPLSETQMGEFVRGYLPETGEQMLQQLGGRLREFGETPLLLMMLCSVFASNVNQIPPNLGSVFRRFTEIYDRQLKQDIPVTDESRRWWKRLLQHLAWVMMGGNIVNPQCRDAIHRVSPTPTEFLVAIPRQQAEEIFTEYLEGKVNFAADCAISWLDDLLKHHLIQIGAENKIEFRHQLIQEYYAAERFLQEVGKLSDDELQWDYLNYLKWTQPTALMLGLLDNEGLALRVFRLALQVDWQLGARLAGAVKSQSQEKTIGLITDLSLPQLLGVRLLGISKSEAAIPILIQTLNDIDSNVRNYAVEVLGKIGSDSAISALIRKLKDENSNVRSSAILALGKIASDIAIPEIITALEDENSAVRCNAASALGQIGSDYAISALITALKKNRDSLVRSSAAFALGKTGLDTVIPALITALEDKQSSVCYHATLALSSICSEATIPALILALQNKYDSVRREAALALGKIGSDVTIDALVYALKNDYSISYLVASSLSQINLPAALVALTEALENKDINIRCAAASALGKIASEASISALITTLEDENYRVRSFAASALGKTNSEKAITPLIKVTQDEYYDVRASAVKALGIIGSHTAIPALILTLKDEFSYVRYCAVKALAKIGSDRVVPTLITALEDKDYDVRQKVVEALGDIASESAIPDLIRVLQKDKEHSIRSHAVKALGKIGSKAAVPALILALQDEISYSPYISSLAAEALGKIGSEEAIPALNAAHKVNKIHVWMAATKALATIGSTIAMFDLIELLICEDDGTREEVCIALYNISSASTIPLLISKLKQEDFVKVNCGDTFSDAIWILEKIQEHLKYYKPAPNRTMSNILSHNYALLIGVGECEEPKLSLPVTVKDIQALKTLLTNSNLCGYIDNHQHLRLLCNAIATSENILDGLNWLKQQAENDPEATIFIYYSGHGCLDASGDYYLIPHETDRADIADTALPATEFNAALQQIPAKQLLVIIDSCHAQGMASSKEGVNRPPLPKGFTQTALPKNIIQQGTGKVVFTSSTGNQSSWIRPDGKMSVFTYHLLEALQGAANQPGDKVVRVSHLMNYLGKTVPETAQDLCKAEQTPFFDFATEDFAIALLQGGKGLAIEGWDKQQAEEMIQGIYNNVAVNNSDVGNIVNVIGGNNMFGDISSNKGK